MHEFRASTVNWFTLNTPEAIIDALEPLLYSVRQGHKIDNENSEALKAPKMRNPSPPWASRPVEDMDDEALRGQNDVDWGRANNCKSYRSSLTTIIEINSKLRQLEIMDINFDKFSERHRLTVSSISQMDFIKIDCFCRIAVDAIIEIRYNP